MQFLILRTGFPDAGIDFFGATLLQPQWNLLHKISFFFLNWKFGVLVLIFS